MNLQEALHFKNVYGFYVSQLLKLDEMWTIAFHFSWSFYVCPFIIYT